MNRSISLISLLSAVAIAGVCVPAASAKEDVILTVEVDTALDSYYKVKSFLAEMQKSEEQAQAAASAIEQEGNALVQEFQDLREQANSDILTEDARQEAYEDAQKKMQEIQAKENELRKFLSETQRQLNGRRQQQINIFYRDVAAVVEEISKERGATLVIDISARAGDGRAPVMYTDGSYDVTPEVIERVNATEGQESEAPPAAAE